MGIITLPTTFTDGTVPTAAQFNGNFNAIANELNGSISNANISASAAIDTTKISGTAVNLSSTQTIASVKTFDEGAIVTAPKALAPSASGTATCDLSLANDFEITMPAGNITIAISNATVGQKFIISTLQDSGGSRTVTWFSTIRWAGGSAPTLTTTASKRDTFQFKVTGSGTYDGFVVGYNA